MIYFTSGSAVITVNHRNHGMHSTSNNVTIAGVASGDHNGIAHSNINGTYTTIGNIKLDSYTVTAANSDTASSSGDIGSTTVTATRNILYDVIQPKEDDFESLKWLNEAAHNGYRKAELRLAYMLSKGEFVEKDEKAALFWMKWPAPIEWSTA